MGGVRLARWGWCLTCLFAFLSVSVCLFPRLGSAAKYPAPPLDGVVYPSLIVPPERVESSPIAEKCYKCHGQEKEAYEWAQSGHAHNLEVLRASPNRANSCLSCHSSGYRLQPAAGWGRIAQQPQITLENAINEVACSSCHSHAREDVEAYLLLPKNELCISCHKMDCGCAGKGVIHQSQAEMFRGVEGRGTLGIPSKHFGQMQGSCTPCHMYRPPEAGEAVLTEGGHTFDAPMSACLPCHQGGAEALVAQRRSEVESLLAQVEEALSAVPSELQGSPLYQDAKHNLDMVHGDGGWGLHNPTYAKALLEAALEMLQALPTEER